MRRLFKGWRIPALVLCASLIASTFMVMTSQPYAHAANGSVSVWLTTPDQNNLLTKKSDISFTSGSASSSTPTIVVNENLKYQQIWGFGASMNDLSAGFIYNKLGSDKRTELLKKLFDYNVAMGLDDKHLMDTAYVNPDGLKVLVVVNNQTTDSNFAVQWGNKYFTYSLPAASMATCTWSGCSGQR